MSEAIDAAPSGYDGPYPAPILTGPWRVEPDWIDYNGHMNVGYYTLAFDRAMDVVFEEHLGVGESFTKAARIGPYALQMHTHYLAELHEGASFTATFQLLDCDAKRVHVCQTLLTEEGTPAAFTEGLLMAVDLNTRRSARYPDWAIARLEQLKADHAALPRSPRLSAPIGIRRRA